MRPLILPALAFGFRRKGQSSGWPSLPLCTSTWNVKPRNVPTLEEPQAITSARIWMCKYRSLAPLADLRNLQTLEIANYPDETLEPVGELAALEDLRILHLPKVTDLRPLARLHQLDKPAKPAAERLTGSSSRLCGVRCTVNRPLAGRRQLRGRHQRLLVVAGRRAWRGRVRLRGTRSSWRSGSTVVRRTVGGRGPRSVRRA